MSTGLIKLGRTPAGNDVHVDLWAPSHLLASGRSRSGKSSAVFTLLARAASSGIPLEIWGVDVSALTLSPLNQFPGKELRISTLREPEKIAETLELMVEQMDTRLGWLLAHKLDKVEEFSKDQPLWLIVFEEFPGLLSGLQAIDRSRKPADRVEPRVKAAVSRLILESAKLGGRVILSAQKALSEAVGGTMVRESISTRISFAQNVAGIQLAHEDLSTEEAAAAAHFLPGVGFIETPTTPVTRFRADFCSYQTFVKCFQG